MGKREREAFARGWCTTDEYHQLHNPSRLDWCLIRFRRRIRGCIAFFKEYGVLKGLLLLLIYVLIGIVLAMILAGLPTAGPEGKEG